MKPHDEVVATILQTAGRRLGAWWLHFHSPPNLDPGLSERGLSFQFATAFLDQFPNGEVLMDRAIGEATGKDAARQLDTYLFTDEYAFRLACRNDLYQKDDIPAIAGDMTQMTATLATRVGQRSRRTAKPSLLAGVVLTVACGDSDAPPPWPTAGLPPGWTYGTSRIVAEDLTPTRHGPQQVLYWLYAVSPPVRLARRRPTKKKLPLEQTDQRPAATAPAVAPEAAAISGWVYEGGKQAQALEAAGARLEKGNPAQDKFLLVFSPTTQRLVGAFRISKKIPTELVTRGWIYHGTPLAKLLLLAGADYISGNPLPQEVFVFDKVEGTVIVGHYRLDDREPPAWTASRR